MPARDLDLLIDCARKAGQIAMGFSGQTAKRWDKADGAGPVTEADLAVNAMLHADLTSARPDFGWLSEESEDSARRLGQSEVFIIDPIDGTRGFVSGTPTWGVLIAVGDADGPFLGMVDQPYTGERFFGTPQGATLLRAGKEHPIQTRVARPLSEAIVFTTFPEVGSAEEGAAFRAVASRALLTRYGMDCYAYALVASGQVDLVIEAGLQAYDIQGPLALIEAAGGIVTDWNGGLAHQGGQVIAAANSDIHAEALAILRAEMGQ